MVYIAFNQHLKNVSYKFDKKTHERSLHWWSTINLCHLRLNWIFFSRFSSSLENLNFHLKLWRFFVRRYIGIHFKEDKGYWLLQSKIWINNVQVTNLTNFGKFNWLCQRQNWLIRYFRIYHFVCTISLPNIKQ